MLTFLPADFFLKASAVPAQAPSTNINTSFNAHQLSKNLKGMRLKTLRTETIKTIISGEVLETFSLKAENMCEEQ